VKRNHILPKFIFSVRNMSWAVTSCFLDSAKLFNTEFLLQVVQLPPLISVLIQHEAVVETILFISLINV